MIDYADVIMGNAARRATARQLEAIQAAFGQPMDADADWRATWRAMLPVYFERYVPAVGTLLDQQMYYSAAAYNHASAACLPAFNSLPALQRIATPTLILSGASDWITPPHWGGGRLHQAIAGSRCVTFDFSGHFPYIERGPRFYAALLARRTRTARESVEP